jgi:Tol biopolymer transport system component
MRGSTGVVALTWLVLAGACVLPASAAFPGANGRIVFASNRRADLQLQVFAVPAEGGLPRNVSRRPAYINTDASVGPGGTIVFASAPAGDFGAPGVWAVGPGGKRRRLASGLAPSVSPDGALVAYTSPHADGLLVVSAHGGRARTLSDTSAAAVWSPDGRWLAAAGNGVLLLRADGVETRRLAEGLNANFSLPSWSPDGRGIVVSDGVLHVVEVATGQETPLKEGTDPVWSPKGDLIAFVRAGQIATIRPDGSRMRDVTAPPAGDADMRPAWAPDGIRLAFVRKRPAADVTEASQLGVVNVVSGEMRALTPADGRIVDPFVRGLSWSADGFPATSPRSLRTAASSSSVAAPVWRVRRSPVPAPRSAS